MSNKATRLCWKRYLAGQRKKRKKQAEPEIRFGRYSDNNKTVEKVEQWNDAENLFKEKKYFESIAAFFEYLKDDEMRKRNS